MTVSERIEKLRSLMSQNDIDAYVIPTADFHQSEYVGEHFKARAYISGFTGSYGTVVITKDDGRLWTDGRYFLQAETQLAGSGISLMKMNEPEVPMLSEWLADTLPVGSTLGFDGRVVSVEEGQEYETALTDKQVHFQYSCDLIKEVWENRPAPACEPVFILEEKYAGESTASKLKRVREAMHQKGATVHVIASLDDIAWLINMRGNDIEFFPMILSYAVIHRDSMELFIDDQKLNDTIKAELAKNNIEILPYNDIYEAVKEFSSDEVVMLDPTKMNYAIYNNIPANVEKVTCANPTILFKAMKNQTELKNIRAAHIKDGIAITKFMHWVKTNVGKIKITELSAAAKLEEFRKEQNGYLWQSFEPICAYKEHAAMMHYDPTPETDVELKPEHLFLNDTGGNYYEGSTDITRTFILGPINQELKLHYTTVVRAMMNLSRAKFLYGCYGYNLDILARGPIWDLNIDYKCGTGHGVGYLLNIHEPPTGFRWNIVPSKNEHHQLEEGMVITNEPGIYIDGSHGIRIENELIVTKAEKNEFGQFMHLDTITFAPIDLDGIDPTLLSQTEKDWLNNYHHQVYTNISPHLTDPEKHWLKEYTKAI
ncbi:MAG: aminopeptidase P family protein [Lachnospiraceae bacterium]